MGDVNRVVVSGRLTQAPIARESANGRRRAHFRLAVNRSNADSDFFPVVCFDDLADDVTRHLRQSSHIIVEGRLAQREFDGREQVEIIATDVHFLSGFGTKDRDRDRDRDRSPNHVDSDAP
jgi:single-strand DNA-binding protein